MSSEMETPMDELLAIRKPGAHLADVPVTDEFAQMLGVDLEHFPKFDRVDDTVTYPKTDLDIRWEIDVDSGRELDDYSGPYLPDLRFTDFSIRALATKLIPWSEAYLQMCVDGWADEVTKRFGAETMAEIEWAAWNDQIVPELERMASEFLPVGHSYVDPNQRVPESERAHTRVIYTGLFTAGPDTVESDEACVGDVVPRQSRVPAAVHRSLGHASDPAQRPRRNVRPAVHAVG